MKRQRLGLPFQLHRADTLQFVVSSSNAGLFIPHFAEWEVRGALQ
jgi:hypothetical protein